VVNHTHNQYNKHYLISIVINVTSGKIRTVAVTNTSYFIFEPESGNWSMSTLPWMSQVNTNQYSTNQGLNWVNNSYTINTHLHQYSGSEYFWYRGCIKIYWILGVLLLQDLHSYLLSIRQGSMDR
jgi:hypothetical protein